VVVAPFLALCGCRGLGGVAFQPRPDVVVIELLRPEQAGPRLTDDSALIRGEAVRSSPRMEQVGFRDPLRENAFELGPERLAARVRAQSEPKNAFAPCG